MRKVANSQKADKQIDNEENITSLAEVISDKLCSLYTVTLPIKVFSQHLSILLFFLHYSILLCCLQLFDAVGCAAGRASGL